MSALAAHQADYITEEQAACPACELMFSLSRSVVSAEVTLHGNRPLSSKHKVTAGCLDLHTQRAIWLPSASHSSRVMEPERRQVGAQPALVRPASLVSEGEL